MARLETGRRVLFFRHDPTPERAMKSARDRGCTQSQMLWWRFATSGVAVSSRPDMKPTWRRDPGLIASRTAARMDFRPSILRAPVHAVDIGPLDWMFKAGIWRGHV